MNGNLRTTVVAVSTLAPALLGGGCAVDEPDAAAWDKKAETALTDAAGEVATARLMLRTAADERVWSSYAVVVLAEAEEAAGTLEEDLATLQAPPERRELALDVLELLDAAVTGVREAREAAVDGEYDDPTLARKLDRLIEVLETAAES